VLDAGTIRAVAHPPRARVDWVDYSKGICIFLVVMLHANNWVQDVRGHEGWLQHVVNFARPFRMPDFFLIAGLFLARVIDRPWRTYLDKKVLHFAYFYGLWVSIQFVLFPLRESMADGLPMAPLVRRYLMLFVQPQGSLWFIHSLAIYFVIVRLTKRVPWWLMIAVCGGLQTLSVDTGWTVIDEFARRFVYFYSGYALAPQVFRLASWGLGNTRGAIAYLAVWGVANQLIVGRGWSLVPGVGLVLGYVGAIAVVFMGVLLSRTPGTGWLRYLGENSLVVYLGYYVCERAATKLGVVELADVGTAALALTACSVAGAVLLFRVCLRLNVSFLYRRPAWARLGAAPPPPSMAQPLAA
jgi:uncharacterized membrane protein YcfT